MNDKTDNDITLNQNNAIFEKDKKNEPDRLSHTTTISENASIFSSLISTNSTTTSLDSEIDTKLKTNNDSGSMTRDLSIPKCNNQYYENIYFKTTKYQQSFYDRELVNILLNVIYNLLI